MPYIIPFRDLDMERVAEVGGKNASLGELIKALEPRGVRVPDGFAITADGFRLHLRHSGLEDQIYSALADLDVGDLAALSRVAAQVREHIRSAPLPPELEARIAEAYRLLSQRYEEEATDVAVRSSATAEDPGVMRSIASVIERAHAKGRKVGLCGQAPSNHPEFAKFLAEQAIDSISVTPDALPEVLRVLSTTQ